MKTRINLSMVIILIFQMPVALAQWEMRTYPGMDYDGDAFEFEEVAEDVYQARGTGNIMVGSEAGVIINEHDVVIVDSLVSPASAQALTRELKKITDKPIKYVVNTHFHFDHAHGNQIYPPDVQVIGHEYTYEMIANGGSLGASYQNYQGWIASERLGPEGQEGLIPTPPNTLLTDKLTLHRGGREIQVLFLGRGHTGGDVVVFLPEEKILFTGDLLLEGVPFMGDGFLKDWIGTLENVEKLDFEIVVPGHGRPYYGRESIGNLKALLADYWEKAGALCDANVSVEQAAAQVDLTNHAENYPEIDGPGAPDFSMQRIYELRGCHP